MSNTEVKLLSADCSEGLPLVRLGRRHAIPSFFMDGIFVSMIVLLNDIIIIDNRFRFFIEISKKSC